MPEPARQSPTYTRIYAIIRRIPRGRVSTYGRIAIAAKASGARQVGYALHALHDDAEVDGPRRGSDVDRGEDAVDAAVRRHYLGGRDPRGLKRDASHRLPDGRRRHRRHERRRGAAGFGHHLAVGAGL